MICLDSFIWSSENLSYIKSLKFTMNSAFTSTTFFDLTSSLRFIFKFKVILPVHFLV